VPEDNAYAIAAEADASMTEELQYRSLFRGEYGMKDNRENTSAIMPSNAREVLDMTPSNMNNIDTIALIAIINAFSSFISLHQAPQISYN
jgi:hypothetical protein